MARFNSKEVLLVGLKGDPGSGVQIGETSDTAFAGDRGVALEKGKVDIIENTSTTVRLYCSRKSATQLWYATQNPVATNVVQFTSSTSGNSLATNDDG